MHNTILRSKLMVKFSGVFALAFALAGLTAVAEPDILRSVEDGELRLPDFSYAGYKHSVEEIPNPKGKQIDITTFGAIANDGLDDSQAILKALDKAHATKGSVVVLFPQGKFIVSEVLKIKRSNIVLRGTGAAEGGTTLFFPRPLKMVDKGESLQKLNEYLVEYDKKQREKQHNIDELFSEYSWSGGFIWIQKEGTQAAGYLEKYDPEINILASALEGEAGAMTVTVDSARSLKKGEVLELLWFNRKGENGPLLKEIYGDTKLKIGSHHWTRAERPLVRQKTQILAIDGDLITISDPLLHSISSDIPAQFAEWSHLEEVGVEEMHLQFPEAPSFGHHLEQGYNGVYLTSVYNGWIRNVNITNADSGVLSYNSANITIGNIRSEGMRRGHYAIHAGNVHNVLVENLFINNPLIHSLSFNTQSTKSVFKNAHVFKTPVLDQHAGSNHQNLFDNVHLYITALRDSKGRAHYPIWNGSGAPYWQPGHGRYNTTWNLQVTVEGGASRDEKVLLHGKEEGPQARIVGVSGNRQFDVNYRPTPYLEAINETMRDVPSLFDWQLKKRLQ